VAVPWASAAHAQTSVTTTTESLLVGQTTVPATTTTATTAPAVSTSQAKHRANADIRRVWYIVGGLLAVALLLAILTIRYWYTTRPGQALTPRHAKRLETRADRAREREAAAAAEAEAGPEEPAPAPRRARRPSTDD
jgi:hypothetical protein